MKYDKHPRNLLQQNLGIKPPCTSIYEQAALILLLKPVLSISSIRTTFFCDTAKLPHAYFMIVQLKPFPTNFALITTMQSHRSDCAIPQFHNHLILKPQLFSYPHSHLNLHKIPLYPKYSIAKSPFDVMQPLKQVMENIILDILIHIKNAHQYRPQNVA